MSGQIDDGGAAFPCEVLADRRDTEPTKFPGMSLRDWFAGQERIGEEEIAWEVCEALAGPRPSVDYKADKLAWFNWTNKWQAAVRYARADAMIAARKGGGK